jgi:hypothetical protein
MPNEHHHGPRNGRRGARHEPVDAGRAEPRRLHPDEQERMRRNAGGRSEDFSRQRDAEQRRAGYSPRDWDRQDWPRNTRSEPDWDPERGFARSGDRWEEDRYDGSPRYDRNEAGPAARGFGDGPRGYEGEHGRFGQQLSDAGRRLLGKVRRIVRNPKNYKRSDERIREDVCDRLSVSDEVDPVDIEVMVENGEVTLTGSVETRQMKFIAEETADDVPGVHEVHNQLRVPRG